MDLCDFRRLVCESILYVTAIIANSQWLVDDYVRLFEQDVTQIIDACAQLRSTTKRIGTQMHRFLSDEARSTKRACRRAERHL